MVSDLGLHCLPISHKKDARLTWVNIMPPWFTNFSTICLVMCKVYTDVGGIK